MEIFAFVTGVLYLILEIYQNKYMWLVNFLCAVAYAYVFAQSSLYAAMGLQIYYVLVSVYGFWAWHRDKKVSSNTLPDSSDNSSTQDHADSSNKILYRKPSLKWLLCTLVAFAVIFILMLTFLRNMTGDPMPAADAFATSLSIVATVWLGMAFIHQWLLWIVVNVVSVGLFLSQGLYLTSMLYLIYALSAVYGFFHWKKRGSLIE